MTAPYVIQEGEIWPPRVGHMVKCLSGVVIYDRMDWGVDGSKTVGLFGVGEHAVVLETNDAWGRMKVLTSSGMVGWCVRASCKVVQ